MDTVHASEETRSAADGACLEARAKSEDFTIRDYREGDEKQIVDLLVKAFPKWSKLDNPLDYYRWKLLENPVGKTITVATIGEKIIGQSNGIHLRFKIGGSIVPSELGGDSVTDPSHRGKGVYTKILDYEIKQITIRNAFAYWVSKNPYILSNQNKRKDVFKLPHGIAYMIRIDDVDHHLKNRPVNKKLIKYVINGLKLLNSLVNLFSGEKRGEDYEIMRVRSFDDSFDAFWEKTKDDYDLIQEKNMKHLNWRYGDPRGGEFAIFKAVKHGETLGYIVVEITKQDGYREGYVSELLTLKDRKEVSHPLIRRATEHLRQENVNVAYYLGVTRNPYIPYLEKNGFIDAWKKKDDVYGTLRDEKLLDALLSSSSSRAYLSYGDFL